MDANPQTAMTAVQTANRDMSRFQAIRAAQTQMVMNPESWPYQSGERIQVGGQLKLGAGFQQYLPLILLSGLVFFVILKK